MSLANRQNSFWMRPVSFSGLLRMLHLVAEYPEGLRARDLDAAIIERKLRLTKTNITPSRTTFYHYRNTLLHLKALRRKNRNIFVHEAHPYIQVLLNQAPPSGVALGATAREAFASLVLQNVDCKSHFFDLFMPSGMNFYTPQQFREVAQSVTWQWQDNPTRAVVFFKDDCETLLNFRSQSEVKSILYGLRYWARDELYLVDEFFQEGRGSVLYPIHDPPNNQTIEIVVRHILSLLLPEKEWTTFSLHDLAVECCERLRQPLESLHAALKLLCERYSGSIALIPTSRSFATFTARSRQHENFHLRGYYRDARGRYISHFRVHRSVVGRSQDAYPIRTIRAEL